MNNAKVIQVIVTESNRGLGREGDPVRNVTQYWTLDGELLATVDPLMEVCGVTDSALGNV